MNDTLIVMSNIKKSILLFILYIILAIAFLEGIFNFDVFFILVSYSFLTVLLALGFGYYGLQAIRKDGKKSGVIFVVLCFITIIPFLLAVFDIFRN